MAKTLARTIRHLIKALKEGFNMAIVTRIRNGRKYLYEETYIGIIDGKQKYKSRCLGRIDDDGKIELSRKNRRGVMKKIPADIIAKKTVTEYIVRPLKT